MTLMAMSTVLALVLGMILPLRWGVFGFLAAAAAVFFLQTMVSTLSGFEGTSWDESLLLFGGSVASYVGFNILITLRAFALPVLVLAVVFIARQSRAAAK